MSAITTSAPTKTRSPTAIDLAAEIDAPLRPTSQPISIVAPAQRVRRITRPETPSAVRDAREIKTLLRPIAIREPRSRLTIGRPIKPTSFPTSTPRARNQPLQKIDDERSLTPWKALTTNRRGRCGFVSEFISNGVNPLDGS